MKIVLTIISSVVWFYSFAQDFDSLINIKSLNVRAIKKIEKHVTSINRKLEKTNIAIIQQMQKEEEKLKDKLQLKDSVAAKKLFSLHSTFIDINSRVLGLVINKSQGSYIAELDSLKTGLLFLERVKSLPEKFPKEWGEKITTASKSAEELQAKFQRASDLKSIIKERRQMLRAELEKFGMKKELEKLNKKAYYYQQQVNEYKSLLKDRKKVEEKAMAALRRIPAFSVFMTKHSQLAQFFQLPDNYGTSQSLIGLQSRASVQSQLQMRFASSGVNPQQYIQQQMGAAQAELNALKDKINKAGGSSNDIEMPDFKPNSQKTRSFLKRMEWGANVQSQKTNAFLPVTSDLALTAGYKLNDKSVIGIGASYKLGWGSGWQHIKLTNEGIGLRSYIDMKLKGSIWISGGYDKNYQLAFTKIEQLKDLSAWQTSGLLGLTKKYKIGKKTNNLQLLWDFLSYYQVPKRQTIVFRVGVVF